MTDPPHSARPGLPAAHRRVPRAGEPVPLSPPEANRQLMFGTRHRSGHESGHGNNSDTEGTLREELTREPFLAGAGVH